MVLGFGSLVWCGRRVHESRGSLCSSWWREVGRIRDGWGVNGDNWFEENVRRNGLDDSQSFTVFSVIFMIF